MMSTSQSCDEARAVLAVSIAGGHGTGNQDARAAAMAHVAGCRACQARLADLAGAVLHRGEAAMPCAEARDRLATALAATGSKSAVDDVARMGDAGNALPKAQLDAATEAHLTGCAACSALFTGLSTDLLRLAEGRLPTPPTTPRFDTSFLRGAPPAPTGSPGSPSDPTPGSAAEPQPTTTPMLPLSSGLVVMALALLLFALAGMALLASRPVPSQAPAAANQPEGLSSPTVPGPAPTRVTRIPLDAAGAIGGEGASALAGPGATATAEVTARAEQTATTSAVQTVAARRQATRSALRLVPARTATPLPVPTVTLVPTEEPTAQQDDPSTPPALEPRCTLSGGLGTGILVQPCDRFPARGGFDTYTFHVSERSRWQFSLCGGTEVNTLLALYAEGEFKIWAPCENVLAYDDDGCGEQSVMTVDLEPGGYVLLVTDKTGDAAGAYNLFVSSEPGAVSNLCPMAPP